MKQSHEGELFAIGSRYFGVAWIPYSDGVESRTIDFASYSARSCLAKYFSSELPLEPLKGVAEAFNRDRED